ncbi:hypothetical protein FH972_015109 [Carpinus fangiana]|uniref:Uncharacterized protein n=1 Tax=Carpinus fangiana TaxID=176857 RepID=A0A5N6RC33_9ROSI|nr:hypothetical protein FH972_015109 [Carpinus fangiana]
MAPPTSSKSNKSTPISSARAWTNVVTLCPSLYACLLSSTSRFTLTLALCSNRSTTQTLVILVTRHGQATWAIAERVEQRGRVDKLGEAKSLACLKARSRLARCWFTSGIAGLLVRRGNHGLAGDAGWQTYGLLLDGCDSECMKGAQGNK